MDGIQIDKALLEDKIEINRFFELVLRHTFEANDILELEGLLNDEIEDKRLCLEQCFKTNGQDRFFLIGKNDDSIVASIEFGLSNELLNICTNGELRDMLEIGTLFVHPSFQKQGIGSLMFRSLFDELVRREVDKVCFDSGYKTAQRI